MNSGAPGLPSIFRVDSDVTHAEDEGGDAAHLRQAVIEGDEGLVRELLDHGADIEAADIVGRRALHQAVFRSGIKRNSITLAKLLLDCGANVEATTYDGEKPLWIAAKHGTVAMAKMLLERGADVESFNPKSGTTALFEAVNRGHVGLIELLLESGADIDARPLASHDASRRQDVGGRMSPESPDLVLTGAPRYSRHHRHYGGKELRPGAGHGHGDGSKAKTKYSLLDYLAGKSASKKDDVTEELEVRPAKRKRRTGSVYRRATTSHGGHEHAYPTPAPDLPPERFTDSGPGAALPRRGDVPTAQPHAGRELPLHQAVANGHAEVVKLLLQHGADPGIRDKNGRTAKQVAEQQDLEELATLFRTGPVLEGPAITSDKGKQREVPLVIPAPHPTPRNNPAKMAACQAFEATIIEFYTEEREQRYQQSATIYDLLYGKGPDEILSERRPESLQPRQADFTWYHLPANNVGVVTCTNKTWSMC
ncbi:ankyrin repeat-containing domain protein [Chaetomium strumarium]|uniref:Ankyrin repeat-containing domain protein n=1 Tax=Chaetomium strumarium TaxID=1170767 RepID=A0AAJ0GZZ2_9PEZI|nr:ankyrin repeat-containing domain protein [Chaetomium strumarium]